LHQRLRSVLLSWPLHFICQNQKIFWVKPKDGEWRKTRQNEGSLWMICPLAMWTCSFASCHELFLCSCWVWCSYSSFSCLITVWLSLTHTMGIVLLWFCCCCQVLRDGRWSEQEAVILVPGDIISIKLGDIIPADARLLEGDPLKIDQVLHKSL
jgi:hypothetical protein